MRKNTKAFLVFLCALVMVLTGIGMPKAYAAGTVDDLTVDHIFDSLGAALEYGTVAREWTQNAHAETNACVDVMNRLTNTIFSNTGSTYFHALGYELQADVTTPENPNGMVFALFKQNEDGTDYTMCPGTEQQMAAGVTATTLTWNIGDKEDTSVSELKNTRLFVMQVENGTYVKDGTKNEAELIVTYGPSISASAYNTNYINKMFYPSTKDETTGLYYPPLGEGDSLAVFNTTSYSPGIEFGPETRAYYKDGDKYVEIDPNDKTLNVEYVLVNYYYGDESNPTVGYTKLDGIGFKNGAFVKGNDVINISYSEEKGYASSLVSNAAKYAQELANMNGGEITSLTPNANGGSTVVGPKDENGNVVSLYEAEVGADGIFRIKEDMGWAGIPVAPNEYVIINVVCPSKDGKVFMGTDAADITYFHSEGQTQGEGVQWGSPDSNSSQRVIFNFVYADENGIMRPYEGTVEPTSRHGGTLLVPNGKVELIGEVHNGAIIADEVYNGQEIHQRCFAAQARSTWVRMDCGTIWLQKASLGYNWQIPPYGAWEDMSSKVDLSGAVFGVYSNKNCTEDSLVMTMTTDETGKATSDLISAGTYWVKEITTLKDHNLSEKVVEVKVVASVPTQVMGGGYFVENGGHWGPGFVWVPHYDEIVAEEKFVNQQNNGYTSLRLLKNDDLGNVLQNAEFGIYTTRDTDYGGRPTGTYSGLIATAKTNRNGVALFENVPLSYGPVTYYIMETAAPEGYNKSERVVTVTLDQDDRDKIVTIDGNGNAAGEAFVNVIIRGNIALKKVDAAKNTINLAGAEFTIYRDAALTDAVGVMTTDRNGIATSKAIDGGKGLIPGTYYVAETKAPDGYKLPMNNTINPPMPVTYTVKVLPGKMVDVLTGNELVRQGREPAENFATPIGNNQVITIKGQKNWHDQGFEDKRPQQVTIELYKKVTGATQDTWLNDTKISGPDWAFEFKTDLNGDELPRYDENGNEIEYIVREDLGYNQPYYSFVKQEKDDKGNITVTVGNSIKTTKVVGQKVWDDTLQNVQRPNTIKFLLFQEVDGELIPILNSWNNEPMIADGYAPDYKFQFESIPTYDVNGKPATYVVKEAESDDYHLVDSASTSTTENNTTTVDFTLTNRLTVPLKGTKTWDDGGRTNRPEVVLEIKQNGNPFPLTGPAALKGVEIIWDKETDPDVWTWKVVGLPKYDEAGDTYEYTVTEKPMLGYKQEVTTDENGGVHFTNTLDGSGRIRLYKMDDAGNWLNGVTFNIYTDESCSADSYYGSATTEKTGSGENTENGKLTAPVPYGTYYLKEAETVEGYQPNNKVYVVHVFKPFEEPSDIENGDEENPKDPGNMNVVVNKKVGDTTSVTINKHWRTGEPQDVSKYLFLCTLDAKGNPVKLDPQPEVKYTTETTVDGDTLHCYTWSGLPKCDDKGNEIEYVVIEEGLEGYFTTYSGEGYAADGGEIVNTVATGTFNIYKSLVNYTPDALTGTAFDFTITPDENNPGKCELRKGEYDDSLKTTVTADENGYTVSIELQDVKADAVAGANVFFKLRFPAAGTYTFKVQEIVPSPVPNNWEYDTRTYTMTFTVSADGTVKTESDAYDHQFYNYLYDDTELVIGKYWDNDTAATRPVKPENFAQYLTLRYAEYPLNAEGYPDYGHEFSADEWKVYTATPSVVVENEDEWIVTYENLPSYIGGKVVTWSVVEKDIPGYTKVYDDDFKAQWATGRIENTYVSTSVTVSKSWPTSEPQDVSDYLFLCTLDANGKPVKLNPQPEVKYTEDALCYTWSDLPKCDDKGNEIKYAVIEEGVEGCFTTYSEGGYAADGGWIMNTFARDIFNIYKGVQNFATDDLSADASFNFTIIPGEKNPGKCELSKLVDAGTGTEEPLKPDEKGNYTVTFEPEEGRSFYVYFPAVAGTYTFDVQEVVPSSLTGIWGYDTHIYTVTFTVNADGTVTKTESDSPTFYNAFYGITNVTITKFWIDENGYVNAENAPNIADQLTLCKLVNGEPTPVENAERPEYTFNEGEVQGVYTWSGLPMYDENGNEIEYVVVEQKMPGYEQLYFDEYGDPIYGGTYAPHLGSIENEKVEKTTAVIITKVWVGGPLVDSDISNNLALYANNKQVNEEPEKDGNRYAWYNLPMCDENGMLISYTVKESGIPGYVVSYEPAYIGEDADQEVAKDFAFTDETITNTYKAEGEVVFAASKMLEGRELKAGEFTFKLTDMHGNVLQTVTNDADGNIAFAPIKFTEADVDPIMSSLVTYYIYEVEGDLPGVTYDPTKYEITLELVDDKAGNIVVMPIEGSLPMITFVNTYEEKVYEAKGEVEFDGVKVLNGRDLKAGEFTFILTDKAGKELQRVTNAADGTFAFEPIKYTEKDVPYGKDAEFTYYITELTGDLPGVTYDATKYEIVVGLWDDEKGTIHVGDISECVNEIVFTNTYEADGAVTFKGAKFLLGREFKQGDEFTFELLNEKGDVIDTVTINPTSGTKADFAFKTIKYELADAGKTYTYTYRVKEKAGTEDGMTYDDIVHTVTVTVSDAGDGSLKVVASNNADALKFTNTYLAEGSVLFSGTKTMNGKALVGKDFTFVLTDADGKEIETVTNDKDGKIVFSAIKYELEDVGKTFTYKVYEKNDGKKSVTYDDTVYTVTVKVEDAGEGHLKVTASNNATKLNFTNSYEAKAVLTMNAYKTVNGYKPSVDQVYDFVLLGDDGTEMKAQNKDEVITFGTIGFDEEDVGKTFIYTVKETTEANELLDVDTSIYKVAVTVVDNGDGNLKLETEILKDGKRANGVVFANTATATLAISKTVKGPGPDKAFDLKVTFIGVDGKELEGVYDYDGDVKGTITSGGVIALKDGQSVTIVGLPEGATYTVEENAGPAYTVTVNGKPIAKAEGTLVGHGKLEFINTVEVTTFSVTKVWEGTDLGAITLTLYADGKQITPQPEVTREGDKYTYYNLPKYNEEGEEIVYSAKERGIDGYIRIYNNVEPYQNVTSVIHDGGTIVNREVEEEVHELSFKIRKVWTGVEATEEIPAITLTLYCNGEKLDVPTPKPNSEGWYRYYDLPKTVNGQIAVYTVIEEPIPGYTVTYKTAGGEVVEEGVNGGEIINAKIPQTGDPATLGLWLTLMGASAALLTMLLRRKKA